MVFERYKRWVGRFSGYSPPDSRVAIWVGGRDDWIAIETCATITKIYVVVTTEALWRFVFYFSYLYEEVSAVVGTIVTTVFGCRKPGH